MRIRTTLKRILSFGVIERNEKLCPTKRAQFFRGSLDADFSSCLKITESQFSNFHKSTRIPAGIQPQVQPGGYRFYDRDIRQRKKTKKITRVTWEQVGVSEEGERTCARVCVRADEGDKEIGVQGNGRRSKVLRKRSP